MNKTPYLEFAKEKLGLEFNDLELLLTALTHRSYVNEHRDGSEHNERLEYLGDAVLELVSSDYLFRNYDFPEGVMTAVRSALVRTESICEAGKKLGYEPLVRLSHGERRGSEHVHDSILADCFEALIGAIYIDQGYLTAKKFIEKHILVKAETVIEEESWHDPKSYMQELAQKRDATTPTYRTLHEEGPDHDKTFTVGIFINNKLMARGTGHSKQDAQTEAARKVIKMYKEQEKAEAEAAAAEPPMASAQ